ncbi:hypothetical protein [Thalassospira profundimaris]|uniref:VWA domain-containing protein n=1 Tax=Thalassospira profundimaris TaxID=502049 RepID=A0A367WXC5_9PROT|nr:hypothetical protein [Thalassospira profundimaris]RCK46094.1 hypothetical protein TH30_09695 [Thalassospira profundimaris]
MARRSRKKRRSSRGQSALGIYLFSGFLFALVIFAVAAALYFRPEAIEIDAETLCPKAGPTAITAIVIDRTDSFGVVTKADIETQIGNLFSTLRTGEEISLFTVDETETAVLSPIARICSPQDPDEINPLTGSKPIAERRWIERFIKPLKRVLSEILTEREAKHSPILESLQSISVTHFASNERAGIPRRLILISDLLQNSNAESFYRGEPNFSRFLNSGGARSLNADFRNVDVQIWLVQRSHNAQNTGAEVLEFFGAWFEQNGGSVSRLLRLTGMND